MYIEFVVDLIGVIVGNGDVYYVLVKWGYDGDILEGWLVFYFLICYIWFVGWLGVSSFVDEEVVCGV